MKTSFETVMSKLKQRDFAPLYFLYGEEPLYIDKVANYIEENVMEVAARDFNQVVYYGKDTAIDEVMASAKEFPFGADKKVVIVKEAQYWSKLDRLVSYAKMPQTSTILVICYKYSAKIKESELRAFEKSGIVMQSLKVPDYQLDKWVINCAQAHQFQIDAASALLIADHIGNDLTRIDNEFLKLQIMLPPNSSITSDIIEKYIGISKQYNILELRDALSNRDEVKAVKIINGFCQNVKVNPMVLTISSLFKFYNAMLTYQLTPNPSMDDLRKIFGERRSDKQLQRDVRIASGYSKASLLKIISVLRNIDLRSKGVDNAATQEDLYKEMIYKIFH